MLTNILIGLAAVVVVFLIIVACRPSTFRVVRSTTIDAPASNVFEQVNELRKWEAWSPWGKLDPQMKQTYEGPEAGQGAVSRWNGNGNVGAGSTTIVESRPNELIAIKLEMIRPFAACNDVRFAFSPNGDKTEVTWSMDGKKNFLVKAFGLFVSMDKMVGSQFESGLAQLKSVAEGQSKLSTS
jgi:uncharacterized protein YndB with AHSA1/START domain